MATQDVVAAHPSVACILYHREHHSLLIVRQFRPAVRPVLRPVHSLHQPAESACLQVYASLLREAGKPPALESCFSHELCAGLIDKQKSLETIMSEEVLAQSGPCTACSLPAEHLRPGRWQRSAASMCRRLPCRRCCPTQVRPLQRACRDPSAAPLTRLLRRRHRHTGPAEHHVQRRGG